MADDKKKKKKKAPPVLTPEERRALAEKQVIGAGMALDFRDQAHFYNRAAELINEQTGKGKLTEVALADLPKLMEAAKEETNAD